MSCGLQLRALSLAAAVFLAEGHAQATPPAPPAPLKWERVAWLCPQKQRSSIEIEILAQGDKGYGLRVTELVIDGRKIEPSSVDGLQEILARGNYVKIAGGYCERTGEVIRVEELANGPKANEAGWRRLYVPYQP